MKKVFQIIYVHKDGYGKYYTEKLNGAVYSEDENLMIGNSKKLFLVIDILV